MIHCNKIYLLADNGKEILSMNEVMYYLIVNSKSLIEESKLEDLLAMSQSKWQNFADEVKGLQVFHVKSWHIIVCMVGSAGEMRNSDRILIRNLQGKDHLGDLSKAGKMILK